MKIFYLIHIVAGEFDTPLLGIHVFERAWHQTRMQQPSNGLGRVKVIVLEPLSVILRRNYFRKIKQLRKKFLPVKFHLIPFSSRIGKWISVWFLKFKLLFVNYPVVFHCRGVGAMDWALLIRRKEDKIILDVRGYDPIEFFARKNKFDLSNLNNVELIDFRKREDDFGRELQKADKLITVSNSLAKYIADRFGERRIIDVIPCVGTSLGGNRHVPAWKGNSINIVYVGGAQSYQYITDLVLPFAKALTEVNRNVNIHILSQDIESVKAQASNLQLNFDRTTFLKLPSDEIQGYLNDMDLGLILRSPSFMNNFSQPVKLGEYLAAGLGIVFERGTGDLREMLIEENIGFEVRLTGQEYGEFINQAKEVVEFYKGNAGAIRKRCLEYYRSRYCWTKFAPIEHSLYQQLFEP